MNTQEPAALPDLRLNPGQEIDGFVVVELLHEGGMASIWRVRRADSARRTDDADDRERVGDTDRTDRAERADPGFEQAGAEDPVPDPNATLPLVMKVPRIRRGEDPASIVGFEVEQMILPMLQGPHVPRFVARGDFTRLPYIVMEHIPGPSLRPRLQASPLPVDEVVEIGSRVATALHDLHRQGLVHLDVKPSNVLFRADGSAVLVDFGLSRHDRLPDLLEEAFELPLGTSPYMSPEQVRHVRKDPRSDLFALGVMLYHFTTGQRPYGQPDTVRGLRRRLYEDPPPPRALRPDCPPWLQEVILRCLEVDPERRFQSGAQLALALQHPAQLALTARAAKTGRDGLWQRLARRWRAAAGLREAPARVGATTQLMKSPIVMVALDVERAGGGLLDQLRETVRRIVQTEPGARLACVSVMRIGRTSVDGRLDAHGQSRHVRQLVALKHWARPLLQGIAFDEGRLTFHVLEAADAAGAILDFAERTQVDHIVMGARGASALRRHFGSVSSQVVAQAGCTVTVVRE
ncbi:MAG: bifunctional serine/threonine-protein kinase/universal stress protein [Burkholderiales bacterium]|nr:bifunctional serine/threonine-protein kinase/universal stress protein [Burkholderiales bacterium]